MSLYFFDVHDGDNHYIDTSGQELPDAASAHAEALGALPHIAEEEMPDGNRRDFIADVRDSGDRVIFTATLSLVARWVA